MSPAQLLMGRNLRDFVLLPRHSGYRVSGKWKEFLRHREVAMNNNNSKHTATFWTSHWGPTSWVRGTQNTDTNKWDRSGLVVEQCGFRQYKIKMKREFLSANYVRSNRLFRESFNKMLAAGSVSPAETAPLREAPVHDVVVPPPSNNVDVPSACSRRSKRNAKAPDRLGAWGCT